MKNSSLSLITALYNSEGASDLYKEIYYPIIRYSVTEMYRRDDVDSNHYYALTQLNKFIYDLFDIDIPTLVLGRAVKSMGKEYGVRFHCYSDTTSFRIIEIINDQSNVDVDTKAEEINRQLFDLEKKFQDYLRTAGLDCKKSFFDFFADSEQAIECYLNQQEGLPIINEEYANLAAFIQWTMDRDSDAYQLVKRVLWGSVIAGFLQRKNEALGIKAISTVTYYIDTSLIFALLGYDTIDNVNYARELIREIEESGATPMVHALTREEIKVILESIERQGAPDPTTPIGEAYYREKKHLSDLLSLKNKLYEILTKTYKLNCPIEGQAAIETYRHEYRNHPDVQALREKCKERDNEDFREIHDVMLCTKVNKDNKYKEKIEQYTSFFVTRNSDLITMFGSRLSPAAVIHPGSVIMNLWIHSAQSKNIQQALLTEILTRCIAMNQTDAQRRLRIFAKYAKEAGLTSTDFRGMYTELIRRSAKTIDSTNVILDNESKESVKREEQVELIKSIAKEVAETVYQRHQIQKEQKETIDNLSAQKDLLEEERKQKDDEISGLQTLIQKQNDAHLSEKEALQREAERQMQLAPLYLRLGKLTEEKHQIDKERDDYVSSFHFWFVYIFQWITLIAILGAVIYLIVSYISTGEKPDGISWALIVPGAMLLFNLGLNHLSLPIFGNPKVGVAKDIDRQKNDWNQVNKDRIEKHDNAFAEVINQIVALDGEIKWDGE